MICKNCQSNFGITKDKKNVYCYVGTLVTGMTQIRPYKDYAGEEMNLHFTLDPMEIGIPERCSCWHPRSKGEWSWWRKLLDRLNHA